MKVTRVRYYGMNTKRDTSNFLSLCSVVLDDLLILHGIRIFEGTESRYVVMPDKPSRKSRLEKNPEKTKDNLFYPVSREFNSYLSETILDGFKKYEDTGSDLYFPSKDFGGKA